MFLRGEEGVLKVLVFLLHHKLKFVVRRVSNEKRDFSLLTGRAKIGLLEMCLSFVLPSPSVSLAEDAEASAITSLAIRRRLLLWV